MQHITAQALNNSTFQWTLDFSQVAAFYSAISTSTIRMQVKNYSTDPAALLEWATAGSTGIITYSGVAQTAIFSATQTEVASLTGVKYFDIRVETAGHGEFVVAYGTIDFASGITLSASGPNGVIGTSIPDTVLILTSETISYPGVQPVSLANANLVVTAAQAAQTAAAASASSAAGSASTAAAISNLNLGVWGTRSAFSAASIPTGITAVLVLGLSAVGDSPKAVYVRVGSMPSHPGRVQTAAGAYTAAWWEIREPVIYPQQIAATGLSDDYPAIFNADLVAQALGSELVINQHHTILTTLTIVSPVRFTLGGQVSPAGTITLQFTGGIICPPLYQIFGMTGYSPSSTVIKLHDISFDVTPFLFGAHGDSTAAGGGTPDDTAVAAAFKCAMLSNLPLNLGEAIFLYTGSLQIDLNTLGSSQSQGFTIYGSSPGSSGLYFSYSTANGNAFRLYTSVASTQQITMRDMMIAGSFPGVLCALGLDNFADNIVLSTFTNVRWQNSYLSLTHQNEALRLNSANLVNFIGCQVNAYATPASYTGPFYGYAVRIRQGQELSFTGCSLGNAHKATAFTDSISYNCVFTGCGMENADYQSVIEASYVGGGYHVFNGCYLADTQVCGFSNQSSTTSEVFRVISSNTNPGTTVIVDPTHSRGIVVQDLRTITQPAFPTSGVPVLNTTGKFCLVVLEGGTGTPTLATPSSGTVNGISGQTISVVVPPGDTVTRTGGSAWVWYPVS